MYNGVVGLTGVCGTITMITVHNTGTVVINDHYGMGRSHRHATCCLSHFEDEIYWGAVTC